LAEKIDVLLYLETKIISRLALKPQKIPLIMEPFPTAIN